MAEERSGGYCAIQCKCYAPDTHLAAEHVNNFVAASARTPFSARLLVDTGGGWGKNVRKIILGLEPECKILRFDDLASAHFDWPD